MDTTRQAWLSWRQGGIGSSDAAAVHDASPYMTRLELVESKISTNLVEDQSSWAMSKGNEYEPVARRLFAADWSLRNDRDETFEPRNIELADLPILRASLDGATADMTEICEIKFLGLKAFEAASSAKIIPEHYWMQMQHQLLVSGAKANHFVGFTPKLGITVVRVEPDPDFMEKHMKACVDLWTNYVAKKRLPPESDRDWKPLKARGAKGMATKIARLHAKAEKIKAEMDELRKKLEAQIDHPRTTVGRLRFKKTTRQGSVSYSKIPAVAAMTEDELNKYRGKESVFYTMTVGR